MEAFLLAPLKRRIVISAQISLVLTLVFLAIAALAAFGDWRREGEKYLVSDHREYCERLYSETEAEIAAIDKGRCELRTDFWVYEECRRRDVLIKYVRAGGCPSVILENKFIGYPPIPGDPGSFPEYMLSRLGLHLPVVPVGFVAITVLLLLFSDLARRLLFDGHVGWRRLTLVASAVATAATLGWWLNDGEDLWESLVAAFVALVVSAVVFVYGRVVFLWVVAGFANAPQAPSAHVSPVALSAVASVDPVYASEAVAERKAKASQTFQPDPVARTQKTFWSRFRARFLDLPLRRVEGSWLRAWIPKNQYWQLVAASYLLVAVVMIARGDLNFNSNTIARFVGEGFGFALLPLIFMRLLSNRAGWITLIVVGLGYSQGHLNWLGADQNLPVGSSVPYRHLAKGCEFSVEFPGKPTIKIYTHPQIGDYEEALWTSQIPEDSTFLRTECITMSSLPEKLTGSGGQQFILDQLSIFAHNSGLSSVEYQYALKEIGPTGMARGIKQIQGVPVTYQIMVVGGRDSLIALYAGGMSGTFPQREVLPFFASVQRAK